MIDWFYGSDIFIYAEKTGRIKYPVEIKLGRILSKMGRILSDIRPLFWSPAVGRVLLFTPTVF